MDNEKQQIEKCLKQIEEKMRWGPGTSWQNQEFEALSEAILRETNVSLSVSTLKRLWGKIRYEGTPNIATLNALARFAGHQNWRTFASNGFSPTSNGTPAAKEAKKFSRSGIAKVSTALILVVGMGGLLFWTNGNMPKRLQYDTIVFASKPVTNTVPNTVIFTYDAKDSNADSVFIQQSWDPTRRFRVDKMLTEFTSTYYLPGYYRAKLILDTTIVAEHDVFVESDGWLTTINKEPIPLYVPKEKSLRDGVLQISDDFLVEQKIDFESEVVTSFHRVMKDESASDQAFQMDVSLRSTTGQGANVCQKTQIMLMGTDGVIAIPLSIKGCVGELYLVADKVLDGKTNDLSAFGVDFSDWVMVRCKVQDKKISVWINESLAFEGDYQIGIGQIIGTRISFLGTGAVQSFELKEI